ncbi:hypothetical protein OY671_010139, partial [Metschnikowia pulcherrima]
MNARQQFQQDLHFAIAKAAFDPCFVLTDRALGAGQHLVAGRLQIERSLAPVLRRTVAAQEVLGSKPVDDRHCRGAVHAQASRQIGIQPDASVSRSDRPVTESNKRKIALMCDVDEDAVVNAVDVPSIYDIPTMLNEQGLDAYIVDASGLAAKADEVD